MEIRKITPGDWEAYKNLRLSALQSEDALAFGGSYEKESIRTEEEWRARLDESGERCFYGCFNNEKLVSLAGAYLKKEEDKFQNKWIIVAVYTDPEFRKQSLSFKTIKAVLNDLKDNGIKEVILMVNTKQTVAVHVYEKLGFITSELIKGQLMGNGQVHDEYVMSLSL